MKNTIFFLATVFVLQSSSYMFGQSNNSLPKDFRLIQIHQIDLASAEMMSIVTMMLEEQSLLNRENKLILGGENENIDINLPSFEVTLELTLINESTESIWNSPNFPTVANKGFLSRESAQQFENLHAINSTQELRWNIYEPFATNISLQNFIGENAKSFMQPSDIFRWVELESNDWVPNDIQRIPANNFQISNWQGQLGIGVGSYY
ncbi:MAG: hypothetical protein AB8F94_30240 [Saprospiraceae bacterium]